MLNIYCPAQLGLETQISFGTVCRVVFRYYKT
jgi:hypothetical protein